MFYYSEFINEGYINMFDDVKSLALKKKYAQKVWDVLNSSYKSIGGLIGNGFRNIDDMINNIPFWKIFVDSEDNVKIVTLYKFSPNRKSVAVGTDGTIESKKILKKSLKSDFTVSYTEVSDNLLNYLLKVFPDLIEQYKIPVEEVKKISKKNIESIPNEDYYYMRVIGNVKKKKLMVGTLMARY
jgi:hypothetical protein